MSVKMLDASRVIKISRKRKKLSYGVKGINHSCHPRIASRLLIGTR